MDGWDGQTGTIAIHTPASELEAELNGRFGAGSVAVVSRAMGGTTAVELVAGTDRRNQPWPQSVDADIIVVNHGINDLTHDGADLALYRAALKTIAANTNGAKLVFETPNQVVGFDLWPYAKIMREVAIQANVPVADTFSLPEELIQRGDWAHPTSDGYVNIVRISLAPAVMGVATPMLCR